MNHEWNLCIHFEWANETKSFSILHVEKLEMAVYKCSMSSFNSNRTWLGSLDWWIKKTFFPILISSSLTHRIYQDLLFNGKGTEHIVNKQPSHSFCIGFGVCEGKNTLAFKCQIYFYVLFGSVELKKEKGKTLVLHRSHVHISNWFSVAA